MAVIGYRRVSTIDHNLDRQDLGQTDRVFEEKVSGGSRDRPALSELISYSREGDTVVVHSIDRLARDLKDLQQIVHELNDKGVAVRFLKERLEFDANTDDPISKLQLQMMGAFAEFERSLIRSRQAEGIAKAKAQGKFKGGKPRIDRDAVRKLLDAGRSKAEVADELGITRMTVYRIAQELAA